MAAFVVFELWVPLVAIVLRALAGPTVPAAVQVLASLLGLAAPIVVALALSDYLADRPGLVKPYQPKPRPSHEVDGEGGATNHGAGPDRGAVTDRGGAKADADAARVAGEDPEDGRDDSSAEENGSEGSRERTRNDRGEGA